jgi:hypothetical protein
VIFIKPIRSILVGNAGVTAIVGASAVFVHMAEQSHVPPDIIITDVSGTVGQMLRGHTEVWTGRMQVTCRGRKVETCVALGDAVMAALAPATIEGTTVTGVRIDHCRVQNDVSYLDATTNVYTRVMDFMVGGRKV